MQLCVSDLFPATRRRDPRDPAATASHRPQKKPTQNLSPGNRGKETGVRESSCSKDRAWPLERATEQGHGTRGAWWPACVVIPMEMGLSLPHLPPQAGIWRTASPFPCTVPRGVCRHRHRAQPLGHFPEVKPLPSWRCLFLGASGKTLSSAP